MDSKNFRAELDTAIQHSFKIYREYAKQIRALDLSGAYAPARLTVALKAYRERDKTEYRTEECDLLMLGIIFKMFGVSYAIDSYVGKAIDKQIPEISRQRSYGVREEASYLKNMAELKLQKYFHKCVLPAICTDLDKRSPRAETDAMIKVCTKAADFVSRSTKGVPLSMGEFSEGGMTAIDKEEIIASFDSRLIDANTFSSIPSEEQLALEDK